VGFHIPTAAELTPEQQAVFDLPANGRYLVTGPPGTGKTVLALLRARRLVEQKRRPTIVLYNRALGTMVASEARALGIEDRVRTYHQWFGTMYGTVTGQLAPQTQPYHFDWSAIAKEAPRIYAARKSLDLEDIIIDEAQDLPADFFGFLAELGANLTVFADENQRITDMQSTILDLRKTLAMPTELQIRKNFRNTRPVATVARYFYAGLATGVPDLPDRPGVAPRLIRVDGLEGLAEAVCRVALLEPFRNEIGVFVQRTATRDLLAAYVQTALPRIAERMAERSPAKADELTKRARRLTHRVFVYSSNVDAAAPPLNEPGIFVICHASGKGLEFDAVFVALDNLHDLDELTAKMRAYVLSSRPRHELYLSWVGASASLWPHRVPGWVAAIPSGELQAVAVGDG